MQRSIVALPAREVGRPLWLAFSSVTGFRCVAWGLKAIEHQRFPLWVATRRRPRGAAGSRGSSCGCYGGHSSLVPSPLRVVAIAPYAGDGNPLPAHWGSAFRFAAMSPVAHCDSSFGLLSRVPLGSVGHMGHAIGIICRWAVLTLVIG
jgi:hypothetical protein